MLLQSKDEFDQMAKLDPSTGHIRRLSKSEDSSLGESHEAGSFAQINDHLLAIYVHEGFIWVRVDSEQIRVDSSTSAELVRDASQSTLRIVRNGVVLLEFKYHPPTPKPPLECDPTAFIDDEDYDFPFFLFNILRDQRRRSVFFDVHGGAESTS